MNTVKLATVAILLLLVGISAWAVSESDGDNPREKTASGAAFDKSIGINPYFKVKEGKMDEAKKMLVGFCDIVREKETADKCFFYNFTIRDDVIFCREAYRDAEAVKAHLKNVGDALGPFFEITELIRIEIHGPAAELEKLKKDFADLKPDYFVSECGIGR